MDSLKGIFGWNFPTSQAQLMAKPQGLPVGCVEVSTWSVHN